MFKRVLMFIANIVKRIFKVKYIMLETIILIGLFLTVYFQKMYNDNDILFSIGVGLLSSSFITLMLEILGDIRELRDIKKQKKYLFSNIERCIHLIICNEIIYFSLYCNMSLHNKKQLQMKRISVKEALEFLNVTCEKIYTNLLNELDLSDIVFNEEWRTNEYIKNKYLCLDTLHYYEILSKHINYIIENKIININLKIISEEEYNKIEALYNILQNIIEYSNNQSREYLFDYKKQFFDEIPKLFDLLKIDSQQIINVRY